MTNEEEKQKIAARMRVLLVEMEQYAQAVLPLIKEGQKIIDDLAANSVDLREDFNRLMSSQKKESEEFLKEWQALGDRLRELLESK